MAIEDNVRLTTENVSSDSVLEAIFSLFQDDRMVLVELDKDSRIVRWNPGYASACRRTPGQLMNAFPPDAFTIRPPQTPAQPASAVPSPHDYLYMAREVWTFGHDDSCQIRWLKLWSHRNRSGTRFLKLGVREPRRADDHRHSGDGQLSELQAFLDAAPDAIITINAAGTMVSVNPATRELFGYSPSELLGRNVSILMPSPDREHHDEYLARYLQTGEARIIGIGRDITARRKDGSNFPARLSIGEFTARGERYFTGILHDITDRVEAQERQQAMFAEHAHASRVVALGEMASSIAHEINQPLTAIISFADASRRLIETDRHDADTLTHALTQISGQGQRAGEIIRRLREFVQKKTPNRSPAGVNDIISAAAALTTHDVARYGIALELDLDPRPLITQVDRLQIEQVILNLIRNSIEAINESGNQDGRIRIASRLDEDFIFVSVSDNGLGINPSEFDNLFNAFYTTKEAGTGLGLSISHSILEAHDGSLTFQRNEGSGVTFMLTLPTHADE